ncbi:MAG: PadR family transcriptional regulator [Microbacterium sp.]|jgi:DNA-binding PadR family transcriptional regulator|nr:PadR family transcriptional regulator [Microbacterium sp.]
MSVKFALLALLSRQPSTTYQLRKDFDDTTSNSWPLNIGQVSSTLQRLQRDGLVVRDEQDDDEIQRPWHLTDEGTRELQAWWADPVSPAQRGRDELVIKFALAVALGDLDVQDLVQKQRAATHRTLHDLTRLRRGLDAEDIAGRLVLDNHIFLTEAELRWLDDVEETAARRRVPDATPRAPQDAPVAPRERSAR